MRPWTNDKPETAVDRIITGRKIFRPDSCIAFPLPLPLPLPSSRFKCIVKVGPRLNNGKRASGYRERRARADETRALFCMNFYEISRHKTRDNPIGTRVRRVPVTGHKFRNSALVPGRVRN